MPCLRAQRARLAPLEERRQLDLVDVRDALRVGEQLLEMRHEEVADADRARAPSAYALERAPRVEPLAGDGPVDEVEVDVIEAEPLQAGVERAQRAVVALVVVPQLRRDEDLLAREPLVAHRGADVGLVAVDARGVDVAIAERRARRRRRLRWSRPTAFARRRGRPAGSARLSSIAASCPRVRSWLDTGDEGYSLRTAGAATAEIRNGRFGCRDS